MEMVLPGVNLIITNDGGNDILKILNLNETERGSVDER
jgi:hypothetical protein